MTIENPEIAVLIPCYNEEPTIAKVIDDFRKELPNATIYVFDNNSSDRTSEIAKEKNAVVIKEKRQGKGFVIESMFRKVDADYYVMVDGDDTYPAEAVHNLMAPVLNDDADMAVGTRLSTYTSDSFRPLHVFGNRLVINMVNWIFRSDLKDIMSGYRVFSRELVKNIPLISKGFEVETQLVIQSLFYDFKIEEVEIEYRERPEGSFSKLNTFSDGFRVLLTIFNIAKAYRPLLFFSIVGFLFLILGLCTGAIPIVEFFQTGSIKHFPTGTLATGLVLSSLFFFTIGLILDSFNYRIKEIMKIIRK
ncbi:MAG: glycosyltransferase involved in cell wall biosynthesis [bacterium]|jgi:glycosyltransferase involved in cell wall biosynthesis